MWPLHLEKLLRALRWVINNQTPTVELKYHTEQVEFYSDYVYMQEVRAAIVLPQLRQVVETLLSLT